MTEIEGNFKASAPLGVSDTFSKNRIHKLNKAHAKLVNNFGT